jgi:hypothetical protein
MLREKFEELVGRLKQQEDSELFESVHYAIESCGRYIETVTAMEAVILVQRFRLEPAEYRECLMEADKRRRTTHNGLIANVSILNRICKMVELPPIFEGEVENRIEVAEFAAQVATEMFETRKL